MSFREFSSGLASLFCALWRFAPASLRRLCPRNRIDLACELARMEQQQRRREAALARQTRLDLFEQR